MERNRSITRLKETRETPVELLLHGKLQVKSPKPELKAYVTPDADGGKAYYVGICSMNADMKKDKFLHLDGESFDNIVISRLKALEAADKNIQEKVKTALEQLHTQHTDDFVSIHEQLEAMKKQLLENAKKRMKTSADDPMYDMLEDEKNDLMHKQKALEAKKDRLGIMDSPEEITLLHSLLGNFDQVWAELPFEKKQRAFNILINRVEVEVVSMHWLRLTIDWLDAICPRLDIAYIWKANSSRIGVFTDEEDTIIRQYYYDAPKFELLKLMPKRSWGSIRVEAAGLQVKRKRGLLVSTDITSQRACYKDFCPQSEDAYLFGDYATTLRCINAADESTSRLENPLYALWLLPTSIEDLAQKSLRREYMTSNNTMQGEYFFLPQEHVLFGAGSVAELANEVKRFGGQRALVITGRSLATQTSVVEQVIAALGPLHAGTFTNIRQHTPRSDVTRASELARAQRADVLVSVGGGSPIDATKAVAMTLAEESGNFLPQIAIPTTLSAAEFSHLVGVTNEEHRLKTGFAHTQVAPRGVILDASLTLATPMQLWLSSGIRALDHAVETLYAPGSHPINDALALEAIARLFQELPRSKKYPEDQGARTELQLAAWMSFFGEVNTPMGLSHNLGRRIGASYNVGHGITSCITLPHVMRALVPLHALPLARIARKLNLVNESADDTTAAMRAADAVSDLVNRLALPQHLRDVGIDENEFHKIAETTPSTELSVDDIEALLKQML